MKGININGKITLYNQVPKIWKNFIGLNYMTDEELKSVGFYDVVEPEKKVSEKYGIIYFDADAEVFTYPVESITYSQTVAELKEEKIANLKALYNQELAKTDWYIIRLQEGISVPQSVLDSREALRTECATHEDAINAKTTKASVVDYKLPNIE